MTIKKEEPDMYAVRRQRFLDAVQEERKIPGKGTLRSHLADSCEPWDSRRQIRQLINNTQGWAVKLLQLLGHKKALNLEDFDYNYRTGNFDNEFMDHWPERPDQDSELWLVQLGRAYLEKAEQALDEGDEALSLQFLGFAQIYIGTRAYSTFIDARIAQNEGGKSRRRFSRLEYVQAFESALKEMNGRKEAAYALAAERLGVNPRTVRRAVSDA